MGWKPTRFKTLVLIATLVLVTGQAFAVQKPNKTGTVGEKMFTDQLYIGNIYQPGSTVDSKLSQGISSLGVAPASSFLDVRGGRWGALMPATPLLPGDGVGNLLSWQSLGTPAPKGLVQMRQAAWVAFTGYLNQNESVLGIDTQELSHPGNVAVHRGGELIQINAPRVVDGISVRNSFLTAAISHGNLVLLGARNWGDIEVSLTPAKSVDNALATLREFAEPFQPSGFWGKAELVLIPTARGTILAQIPVGEGYDYRLAWSVKPSFPGELAQYEALVDAHTGELFAFDDTTEYATARNVIGGVLPVSNDGVAPDGIEQAGWPMPFADLTVGADTFTADSGGNLLTCVDGSITTTLSGPFMNMVDVCGAISESTPGDTLDLGTSAGTDCVVPVGSSPGNTHASRSGFYEMNRIKEMARGQIPDNVWLSQQLTANMNINQNCNANWSGTVNFYTSGGGCANTGELAGVFDHEWGHGMDNNDVNPTISNPGEGIADIYASMRFNGSCIGRNFLMGSNCNGYGDPCVACDGVRDIDWANRMSGVPHDITFIDAACGAGGTTPCGGSTHCEGSVYAEANWDLFNRDFRGAPYNYDLNTALEVTTRLAYGGAGVVGNWFNCVDGSGTGDGCNADGGYLNYLAVDDDNGNLNDGTPHMVGLFAAFDRHGIACGAPTVVDSGCAGTPTTAPTVTGTAIDRGASLSWGAIAGATGYEIFRTDGVFACDFGKTKVGETAGTSFTDSSLQNGRDYFYTVIPKGPAASCFGSASSCTTVTPVAGANLSLGATSVANITSGDGDSFFDNCEAASLDFDVISLGTGTQTNVRIVGASSATHPMLNFLDAFPKVVSASMASCDIVSASLLLEGNGFSFGDDVEVTVEVTSDELSPQTRTMTYTIPAVESDFQTVASQTWDFEADLDGWTVTSGTFNQGASGGDGTAFSVQSSSFLDNACDVARSPLVSLQATSTLSLWTNFDIEPMSAGTWYDRASLGVLQGDGTRTLITPDSGRLYNADSNGAGNYSGCNDPEEGWAGASPSWASSGYTSGALQAGTFAGQLTQLEIIFGTDGAANARGFWFDQVTLTNFDLQVADTQTDVCIVLDSIFADGFESGDTSAWTFAVP